MKHIILSAFCILSIEVFFRLKFSFCFVSTLSLVQKIIHIFSLKNVSDHWKEKLVLKYAFMLMRYSLQILFILTIILVLFISFSFVSDDFLTYSLSSIGIMESIIITIGYNYLRTLKF